MDADILAAFDATISDGVDVLSLSIGGMPAEYFEDGIAIGSFHAVKNGITVVAVAGNYGPTPRTVSNVAPWIFTIGASIVDRVFTSYITLGNKKKIKVHILQYPSNIHRCTILLICDASISISRE
ncbi:hypothetical protein SLEP1_g45430 [Rubroshorea leprosula]|uniref:Peptidase S8/S53 domain-containing protein n=1 Tax=Rubroshorea leprosula TaxID=152421 RepID=A0AAV5LJ52_9ROSI|nr:hypothetical protein SLEP1_g45430 [Rubroshorea leprosula]